MKILLVVILTLLIGGFIFFRALHRWIRYRDKKVAQKYCSDNGLKFIKVESYELHTRLYFQKDGVRGWANYETDRNYKIAWKKESPLEKLEAIKLKKNNK